jgi:Cof subfamily protein (haloacid dehalogenase superfamily)
MAPEESVNHPEIRMVALDLDGTVIRSDKRLSKSTVRAIHRCGEQGVRVVLATSRPPKSVKQIYDILKLETYSVHYNGALVYDWTTNQPVKECLLEQELVLSLIADARKIVPNCMVRVDLHDRWVTDRRHSGDDPRAPKADEVGPLAEVVTQPATRLAFVASPEKLNRVFAKLDQRHGDQIERAYSNERVLQLTHPDADKLNAVMWVAGHYGLERPNVMAVGDASNDHGMLEWAGIGAAMGNADMETKQLADVVLPTNDQNGVSVAIKRYVFGEEAG